MPRRPNTISATRYDTRAVNHPRLTQASLAAMLAGGPSCRSAPILPLTLGAIGPRYASKLYSHESMRLCTTSSCRSPRQACLTTQLPWRRGASQPASAGHAWANCAWARRSERCKHPWAMGLGRLWLIASRGLGMELSPSGLHAFLSLATSCLEEMDPSCLKKSR